MEGKGELSQGIADCESKAVVVIAKCQCSDEDENQAHSREPKVNNLLIRNEFIEKISGIVDCGSKPSTVIGCRGIEKDEQQDLAQENEANILRRALSLVHDSQCDNENCSFSQSRKTKSIMLHTKECKIINCLICKGVNDWSDCHTRDCQVTKCTMPFCLDLKKIMQIKRDSVQVGVVEFPLEMSNAGPSTSSLLQQTPDAMAGPGDEGNNTVMIPSTIDDFAGGEQIQVNPEVSSRQLAIQRCNLILEHACRCTEANCLLPGCLKMKMKVFHVKTCKGMVNESCDECKQLIDCFLLSPCEELPRD